ncbi:hypothetical protein [Streptomyces broussonetiae]|uniref:Uncharacterized protein n=1 Tax=Streptomyces broussonetiae TaxID=2686304 RepID=A0A6I6N848_9ACTN|nr:hypothetical protein [Streptomyces broussonetiae]QHA06819.1 hypothetical protein GQF42_29155 [Streptomyces broussonetiae]
MLSIDPSLGKDPQILLAYFRDEFSRSTARLDSEYKNSQYKQHAAAFNQSAAKIISSVKQTIDGAARSQNWTGAERLSALLMAHYTGCVSMIEGRNAIWPYEYMAFSRRMGELWQAFCQLAFEHPLGKLELIDPPAFQDIRSGLQRELAEYVASLDLDTPAKNELHGYYDKIWLLVDSGQIKMDLDLHFEQQGQKVVVDFKSGFGSNEKGNTNRLLLVATIYKTLVEDYRCLLLVRSPEDRNNHYFRTLRDSKVWEAYSGAEAYEKIGEFTGFGLRSWIDSHVDWLGHLNDETARLIQGSGMNGYTEW